MSLPLPIRLLLWPVSLVYGLVAQFRVLLYDKGVLKKKKLQALVVSVGNLTVGGTGKTPMVLWLAEKFLAEGKRVAILSRGYRGTGGTSDEVEVLRRRLNDRVLFGIGPDRYEQGQQIESQQAIDIFLLDDGFQHLQLERDVNILMVDGSAKLEQQRLLPAGCLREPVSARSRADVIVVTRKRERPAIQAKDSHERHIFYAQTRLLGFRRLGEAGTPQYVNDLADGSFFAFCGIGNPQAFVADLKSWHVTIAGTRVFRDHHRYSQADAEELEQSAMRAGAQALVTTEKDEQNLKVARFKQFPVYVAVIDFVVPAESEFEATLRRVMDSRRRAV